MSCDLLPDHMDRLSITPYVVFILLLVLVAIWTLRSRLWGELFSVPPCLRGGFVLLLLFQRTS
jgi:hypothetical protein